jgi:hypothetical protein
MGAHGPLIYDSSIHLRLTLKSLDYLNRISGPQGRNHTIRTLIIEDATRSLQDNGDLRDTRLTRYRKKIGKRLKREPALRFRVTQELRAIARIRCSVLNFSMSEYVVALIERAAHQEGIRP